jgi:amino acid permease
MSISVLTRQGVLVGIFVFLLINSFKIGFMLSRDVHSGGHLIGIPISIIFCFIIGKLLFYKTPWRELSSIIMRVFVVSFLIVVVYSICLT